MRVDVYGEGDDLVLLHGNPVPPSSLDLFRQRFQSSHRILMPHMDALRVDSVTALELLHAALAAHGVRRAAVLGHSMGVYRAFQLALAARIDVQRIVALSGFAYLPAEVRRVHRELASALENDAIDLAHTLAQSWFSSAYLQAHPQLESLLRRWFDAIGRDGLLASARIETQGPDLRPELAALTMPIYLRTGDLDAVTPVAWAQELARLLPNARLDVVPGAAHFLQFEDAEATAQAVASFLRA